MSEFRDIAATVGSEVMSATFPAIYRVFQSQQDSNDRAFQESRRGLEEARAANRALNRELKNTAVQIEALEAITGRMLLEFDNMTDNFQSDWDDAASNIFSTRKPKPREGAKKTQKKPGAAEKPKAIPKSGIGGFSKSLGLIGLIWTCHEMIERVKKLDPSDPDYYAKASAEVGALAARHGAATIGAIIGAMAGTAIVPGPGTIIGLASGLLAGMYVDYAFGDDIEEITKNLLEYIFMDNPEKMPKKKTASLADMPSANAIEVAFTPSSIGNITRLTAPEAEVIQKNVIQSLVEGNFKNLSFNAGTILFDAYEIDWGVAGAPDSPVMATTDMEGRDLSQGSTPESKMPNLSGSRSSSTTPMSSQPTHTPNRSVRPSSGVTPQSGAVGGGATPSGKDWTGYTYTGDYADILATIKDKESSGGNYTARSSSSTASGAYQFINSTWRNLTEKFGIGKEYRTAADAPPQVQDAVAAAYVGDILRRNNNDLSKVPLEWYTGNSAGIMSASAVAANNGQTGNAYVDDWMRRYHKISGKSPEMVANAPNTGALMNNTAVSQTARAAQQNQPTMVPVMARTQQAPSGVNDQRSPTGSMRVGREPSAADLFRALFSVPTTQ